MNTVLAAYDAQNRRRNSGWAVRPFVFGVLCVLPIALGCNRERCSQARRLKRVFLRLGTATDIYVIWDGTRPPLPALEKLYTEASGNIEGRQLSEAVENAQLVLKKSSLPVGILIRSVGKADVTSLEGIQGISRDPDGLKHMAKLWERKLGCSDPTWYRMKGLAFAVDGNAVLGVLVGWPSSDAGVKEDESPGE